MRTPSKRPRSRGAGWCAAAAAGGVTPPSTARRCNHHPAHCSLPWAPSAPHPPTPTLLCQTCTQCLPRQRKYAPSLTPLTALQLVNLQTTSSFDSHRLNRDTWRNEMVRDLVANNFVFYQVGLCEYPQVGWAPVLCCAVLCPVPYQMGRRLLRVCSPLLVVAACGRAQRPAPTVLKPRLSRRPMT